MIAIIIFIVAIIAMVVMFFLKGGIVLNDEEKKSIQVIVSRWHDMVVPYAKHYKVQPGFVLASIVAESWGDPTAVNLENEKDPDDDSIGLMQVSKRTGAWINKQGYDPTTCKWRVDAQDPEYDLFNPDDNMNLGTKYYAWIRDYWLSTGNFCSISIDHKTAAAKYNGGKNGDLNPRATLHAFKVMRYYDYIQTLKVVTLLK